MITEGVSIMIGSGEDWKSGYERCGKEVPTKCLYSMELGNRKIGGLHGGVGRVIHMVVTESKNLVFGS